MSKNILITGGAGYIGSHTSKLLAEAGYTPIVFDNLSRGSLELIKWGEFERGDLLDSSRILEVMKKHKPLATIHFAAYAYVGESVEFPLEYYNNNFLGSLTLIDALMAEGVNKIVFSSTCATYGLPETPLISEDHPQKPINPYGWSKKMIEQVLNDYATAYGLRYGILRYFNAAGADPSGEIGEIHDPETHLIPLAIESALTGRLLKLFGADYDTKDGSAVRDYIHVNDLAIAHLAALERLLSDSNSFTVNLGVGKGYTVKEVIAAVKKVAGTNVKYKQCPRRLGDPPALVADPKKANTLLKWYPQFPELHEIVEHAFKWHISRLY